MISATVAPERRWRMSMTCLSRRESAEVSGVASDLLGITVAAMGKSFGDQYLVGFGVEKSTVLKIQQRRRFVKREVENSARPASWVVDGWGIALTARIPLP